MPLIFVYGTLRSGGTAAALLDGCRLVGPASVGGTLYDVGGRYPALVPEGDAPVHGELWSCPERTLQRLDDYEGVHEGLFRREAVRVGERWCWTYVAGPALRARLRAQWRIAGGRWQPPGSPGPGGP